MMAVVVDWGDVTMVYVGVVGVEVVECVTVFEFVVVCVGK